MLRASFSLKNENFFVRIYEQIFWICITVPLVNWVLADSKNVVFPALSRPRMSTANSSFCVKDLYKPDRRVYIFQMSLTQHFFTTFFAEITFTCQMSKTYVMIQSVTRNVYMSHFTPKFLNKSLFYCQMHWFHWVSQISLHVFWALWD